MARRGTKGEREKGLDVWSFISLYVARNGKQVLESEHQVVPALVTQANQRWVAIGQALVMHHVTDSFCSFLSLLHTAHSALTLPRLLNGTQWRRLHRHKQISARTGSPQIESNHNQRRRRLPRIDFLFRWIGNVIGIEVHSRRQACWCQVGQDGRNDWIVWT